MFFPAGDPIERIEGLGACGRKILPVVNEGPLGEILQSGTIGSDLFDEFRPWT
jgi:hypothetical protein